MRVLERRDQRQTPLGGQLPAKFLAVLGVPVVGDDLGAVAAGRGQLRRRSVRRHQDHGGGAEQSAGQRDGLGVVPRGISGHAAAQLFRAQPGNRVVGAAELERPHPLEVLALDEDFGADKLVQRAGGDHRGAVRDAVQAFRGVPHIVYRHDLAHGHPFPVGGRCRWYCADPGDGRGVPWTVHIG